jgi:hypothetical protein
MNLHGVKRFVLALTVVAAMPFAAAAAQTTAQTPQDENPPSRSTDSPCSTSATTSSDQSELVRHDARDALPKVDHEFGEDGSTYAGVRHRVDSA